MKRIVYLTFYFTPDLCAGSFRNGPLALELARQANLKNVCIDLYTTSPNRYKTFKEKARNYEVLGNLRIHRISIPSHNSGMIDQIVAFTKYFWTVLKMNRGKKADLVFASSSRLFTAFLGYRLSKKSKSPLYLDVRDIFVDTMLDVLNPFMLKPFIIRVLKYIEATTFNRAEHINLISGGFREYFSNFRCVNFSFFSNGIDNEFLQANHSLVKKEIKGPKSIVYAGNIGEGQGLHKIIPETAKLLGEDYTFLIYGDGGAKGKLQNEIGRLKVDNVVINSPVSRIELKTIYNNADYLFLHLNDYAAFQKVLPSKIFELATYPKIILAGVGGYASDFINNEVTSSFVFDPCDVGTLVRFLKNENYLGRIDRIMFKENYRRSSINNKMATNILKYL